MITYVIGDLFRSPAKVLVNTVNTVGVMGKGIAKDFKTIFPEMFLEYQRLCEQKKIDIGQLYLWRGPQKWVLNFPTKKHWRYPSKPEYIEEGLKKFAAGHAKNAIASVAFPQLGCGHGDLDWETQVRPLMEKYLGRLPVEVFIHLYRKDPFSLPEHKDIEATKQWLRSEPENLAFSEVWDDLLEVLRSNNTFSTLENNKAFSVRHTKTPEEALIFSDGKDFFAPKDSFLDAWQYLRSVGFLTREGLTQGLDMNADNVMALFSKLPYLRPVKIAAKHEPSSEKFVLALQLVPRPAKNQSSSQALKDLVPA